MLRHEIWRTVAWHLMRLTNVLLSQTLLQFSFASIHPQVSTISKKTQKMVKMWCFAVRRSWLCIFIIKDFFPSILFVEIYLTKVSRISSSSEFRSEKNWKRFLFPLGCCIGRIQLRRTSAQSLWDANLRSAANSLQLKWQNANFYCFIRRFVDCFSR